ncbi:MAG: class I tRNA ligase family protein, partial [Flavobacteriaceae bacterium]
QYWKEVDLYLGGSEHATGHLLYSRFWQKFLYDLQWVPVDEYAKKLINQGMILGTSAVIYRERGTQNYISKNKIAHREVEPLRVDVSLVNASDQLDIEALRQWQPQFADAQFKMEDGHFIVAREVEKMSKSKYNVVNPDHICETYGADTLRMYEMFLGPIEQAKPWNTAGISGVHGFLKKFWRLFYSDEQWILNDKPASAEAQKILHQTNKKVTEDIGQFSFNTCVSSFMICVNQLTTADCHSREVLEPLIVLLAPFAPHIAEELWHALGHTTSVTKAPYPKYNPQYLVESTKEYPVAFNGKMRFKLALPMDMDREAITAKVLADEQTQKYLEGNPPKKVIVVPGKIINIVC